MVAVVMVVWADPRGVRRCVQNHRQLPRPTHSSGFYFFWFAEASPRNIVDIDLIARLQEKVTTGFVILGK